MCVSPAHAGAPASDVKQPLEVHVLSRLHAAMERLSDKDGCLCGWAYYQHAEDGM